MEANLKYQDEPNEPTFTKVALVKNASVSDFATFRFVGFVGSPLGSPFPLFLPK